MSSKNLKQSPETKEIIYDLQFTINPVSTFVFLFLVRRYTDYDQIKCKRTHKKTSSFSDKSFIAFVLFPDLVCQQKLKFHTE